MKKKSKLGEKEEKSTRGVDDEKCQNSGMIISRAASINRNPSVSSDAHPKLRGAEGSIEQQQQQQQQRRSRRRSSSQVMVKPVVERRGTVEWRRRRWIFACGTARLACTVSGKSQLKTFLDDDNKKNNKSGAGAHQWQLSVFVVCVLDSLLRSFQL